MAVKNTIDPGKGYRLLGPGEIIKNGDEFYMVTVGEWCKTIDAGRRVQDGTWELAYRRKIERSAPQQPLFEKRASATIKRVTNTFGQRGSEYGDTMRDCQWLCLKAVAKKLGVVIPPEHCRALAIAAMVDIKYQRYQGGYKDDNGVDGIAYSAFLVDEMMEILGGVQ